MLFFCCGYFWAIFGNYIFFFNVSSCTHLDQSGHIILRIEWALWKKMVSFSFWAQKREVLGVWAGLTPHILGEKFCKFSHGLFTGPQGPTLKFWYGYFFNYCISVQTIYNTWELGLIWGWGRPNKKFNFFVWKFYVYISHTITNCNLRPNSGRDNKALIWALPRSQIGIQQCTTVLCISKILSTLEVPDWVMMSWSWFGYVHWSLINPWSKCWLYILTLKVKRVSMSFKSWFMALEDDGGSSRGFWILMFILYGPWSLIHP